MSKRQLNLTTYFTRTAPIEDMNNFHVARFYHDLVKKTVSLNQRFEPSGSLEVSHFANGLQMIVCVEWSKGILGGKNMLGQMYSSEMVVRR